MSARILIERDFSKPPERVFAFLSEHENLGPLFGAKISRLRDGERERNGVGSQRELRIGPLPAIVETVTESEPDSLIRYRITNRTAVKGHRGEIRLSPAGTGTHMRYEISFEGAVIPGLEKVVAKGLERNMAKGLGLVDERA